MHVSQVLSVFPPPPMRSGSGLTTLMGSSRAPATASAIALARWGGARLPPVTVETRTVAQEFTLAPDGFQDIYYPAAWRGEVGERIQQIDENPPDATGGT